MTEKIPKAFEILEARLNKVGSGYIATDKATVADYKLWTQLVTFLDGEFVKDALAPHIESFTKVKEYIARGRSENAAHYEGAGKLPFLPFLKEKIEL